LRTKNNAQRYLETKRKNLRNINLGDVFTEQLEAFHSALSVSSNTTLGSKEPKDG